MGWLRAYLAKEKEKVKELPTFRAKAQYIWEYYKLWIISFACLFGFIAFVVIRTLTTNSSSWIYVTFANTRAELGQGSEIWKEFVEYGDFDLKEKDVTFNDTSYFNYSVNPSGSNNYYQAFVAVTDAGILDGIVMSKADLTALGQTGRLRDLSREECSSIYEKYKDRLLYSIPFDEEYGTDEVPIGIDISDCALVTKYQAYGPDLAFGMSALSKNPEAVELFLEFLFQE